MQKTIIILSLLLASLVACGQEIGLSVGAGLNVGGTSPLPLPEEIREIDGFNPGLQPSVDVMANMQFKDSRWGVAVGLRYEHKGMKTEAKTKAYGMRLIQDGDEISGLWTGQVKTRVKANMLTVPVLAVFTTKSEKWRFSAGPYVSCVLSGTFDGSVFDGYLRKDNPTGDKIVFENGATATYDFSNQLRKMHYGAQAGAEYRINKQLSAEARLSWGLNDIFHSDFETVTFSLYPIYGNLGIRYHLK